MSVLQQAIDGAPPTTVDSLLKKLRNRELVVRLPKGASMQKAMETRVGQ